MPHQTRNDYQLMLELAASQEEQVSFVGFLPCICKEGKFCRHECELGTGLQEQLEEDIKGG